MNLQWHLLSRITLVATLCLLVMASHVLYQSHRQTEQATQQMTEMLGKQLESQLLLDKAGIGRHTFPDFEFWKQSGPQPGVCLSYVATDNSAISRSLCNGTQFSNPAWPKSFEVIYRKIFNPDLPIVRPIALPGHAYGALTVTPNGEMEINAAWKQTLSLMTLSSITVMAVCLLVYLSLHRALRPAKAIVAGLETIESGNLSYRLPMFELNEWQRTAAAINSLATRQQQLLQERQKLVVKVLTLQEQERRCLARELHDEMGQCLAAINAVTASIKQTATQQCPELIADADHINRITAHMMNNIQDMLARLRPAEFDEMGLAVSLKSLVAGWKTRSSGKTHFQLTLIGNNGALTEPQAFTLFRISQECLTNIAKHAEASYVNITLHVNPETATLTIQDDGIARHLPFVDFGGIGLMGIRERVTALNGQLRLLIVEPHGLIVEAQLPLANITEAKA